MNPKTGNRKTPWNHNTKPSNILPETASQESSSKLNSEKKIGASMIGGVKLLRRYQAGINEAINVGSS